MKAEGFDYSKNAGCPVPVMLVPPSPSSSAASKSAALRQSTLGFDEETSPSPSSVIAASVPATPPSQSAKMEYSVQSKISTEEAHQDCCQRITDCMTSCFYCGMKEHKD